MGIVVTIFMLLGLLFVSPLRFFTLKHYANNKGLVYVVGFGLLLAGLWNFLWFGLRHFSLFWGQAALVSGFFMVAVALIILGSYSNREAKAVDILQTACRYLEPVKLLLTIALFCCFLLYSFTLIRLNLGYSIIS